LRRAALSAFLGFCVLSAASLASAAGGGKHCLWRVTNAKAPFYLLGSIHALRASDYPLASVINDAIDQSHRFLFEVNPKDEYKFGQLVKSAATYPVGVQIKHRVRPETWAYLKKISTGGGYEWTHLKPWAIAIYVLQHPGYQKISSAYGIETYIEKRTKKRPHEYSALATVSEHVNVLADMTDIEGEVMLLPSLVYADEGPKQFAADVAAWKAGDTGRLYAMELPRIKEAPTIYWRLLSRRNKAWIPNIEAAIKTQKPTMVVAGALHFSGPDNVISLLRARGYKIEQL
jgi:uncharacterized protein YbaP (TraB family)